MKQHYTRLWFTILSVFILVLSPASLVTAQTGPEDAPQPQAEMATSESLGIRPINVYADPNVSDFFQAPPADILQRVEEMSMGLNAASPTFVIDYVPAGSVNLYGHICQTFPNEAKTAFDYATKIWSAYLNPPYNVPIHIQACWLDLGGSSILGYGGYTHVYRNYAQFPLKNTWYPTALANGLVGSDLNGSAPEMVIAYNSRYASQYYFGTGKAPSNQYNLASIVLHEIAHGLGFAGTMDLNDYGQGTWGLDGYPGTPDVYDYYMVDKSGNSLINTGIYPNPSGALATALTSNNIYFNGPVAREKNGGSPVKMYAPSRWTYGSSYSHLDEIYNGTPNALMTYSISFGETNYDPGPVTVGILNDLGWRVNFSGSKDIQLSSSSVPENKPSGTIVGTLSTYNPVSGFTYTHSLSCPGANNSLFSISGNTLVTKATFDREAKSSYSICVRSTDQYGKYFDKAFTITISNVNEAGTQAWLVANWVRPGSPAGTRVGTIFTDDPDIGDTFYFDLDEGFGDASLFTVVGNQVKTTAQVSSTEGDTYTIRLTYKDQGGLGPQDYQTFTITVLEPEEVYLPILFK